MKWCSAILCDRNFYIPGMHISSIKFEAVQCCPSSEGTLYNSNKKSAPFFSYNRTMPGKIGETVMPGSIVYLYILFLISPS